jgi:hypothetical protein
MIYIMGSKTRQIFFKISFLLAIKRRLSSPETYRKLAFPFKAINLEPLKGYYRVIFCYQPKEKKQSKHNKYKKTRVYCKKTIGIFSCCHLR